MENTHYAITEYSESSAKYSLLARLVVVEVHRECVDLAAQHGLTAWHAAATRELAPATWKGKC